MTSKWLTAAEAVREFGFSRNMICKWARSGNPVLKRKLRTSTEARRDKLSRCRDVPTYYRRDLEAISNGAENATSDFLPASEISRRYGLKVNTIAKWKAPHPCPALGRPIAAELRPVRLSDGRIRAVWHYAKNDVEEITRPKPDDERHVDQRWLTTSEVYREHGIRDTLLHRWEIEGCSCLKGRKLRSRDGKRLVNGKRIKVKLWNRDDLERIQSAREAARRENDIWKTATEAEAEYGIKSATLHNWRYKGSCPPLGRPVRHRKLQRELADGRTMNICGFHVEDLQSIRSALLNGERNDDQNGQPPPTPAEPAAQQQTSEAQNHGKRPRGRPAKWEMLRRVIEENPNATNKHIQATYHRRYSQHPRATLAVIRVEKSRLKTESRQSG